MKNKILDVVNATLLFIRYLAIVLFQLTAIFLPIIALYEVWNGKEIIALLDVVLALGFVYLVKELE